MSTLPPAPRVTVLMTYYNKGPYVEEAARSVLASTFTDLELLVVDDASTDDGLARLRALGDPRIRILESPVNTGRAAAANRGFEAARGEYIAVLDADDRMLPDRLERQVAFMDAHPEVGVSGGYMRAFGGSEGVMPAPLDHAQAKAGILFGMPVYYPSSILRAEVLRSTGVRCDPQWRLPGMDHLLMARLSTHTRLANLPHVVAEYRRGDQNMRHGRDPWADRQAIVQELFTVFGFPAQADDAALLCTLEGLSPQVPNAATVRAVAGLMQRLLHWSRSTGVFDEAAFNDVLLRHWHTLYHRLVAHDRAAAWAHVLRSRPIPWHRVRYLLSRLYRTG